MVDLARTLSNPVGPLKTLLEGPHWIRQDSASPSRKRPVRLRDAPGTIGLNIGRSVGS